MAIRGDMVFVSTWITIVIDNIARGSILVAMFEHTSVLRRLRSGYVISLSIEQVGQLTDNLEDLACLE